VVDRNREPEALIAFLHGLSLDIACVGLEAGPVSQWLHRHLCEAGQRAIDDWLAFGGEATMASYKVGGRQMEILRSGRRTARLQIMQAYVSEEHVMFPRQLPAMLMMPGFVFVHAGAALEMQSERDLFWIRDQFREVEHDFGRMVVHGHTPVLEPVLLSHRVGIDAGCYMSGRLMVLKVDAKCVMSFLKANTRRPQHETPGIRQ
jgi:serine/threonine protein phosphatase 1